MNPSKVAAREILFAALAWASMSGQVGLRPLPEPKPEGYGIHLSKAERKGKAWQELQAMRKAK